MVGKAPQRGYGSAIRLLWVLGVECVRGVCVYCYMGVSGQLFREREQGISEGS